MKGGVGKRICLLIIFISASHAEDLVNSQDLTKGPQEEELRSGAFFESSEYVNEGANSYAVNYAGVNSYATNFAGANSHAVNFADAVSRVIPQSEYIMPHTFPGAENVISCSREGELHYFQSPSYPCMVCACVREYGLLIAVCVSCSSCTTKVPEPVAPSVVIQASTPQPEHPVSCHPLPSGQPFQNPLNPCQICTCAESINYLGERDVQIECKENPQCVLSVELSTLPPIPEAPVPIPLPTCENFPQNVLFPHPTDACKVCKCSVEAFGLGIPEQHITCYPNPGCAQKPFPVDELIISPPEPYQPSQPVPNLIDGQPIHVPNLPEPILFPDIVTPAPVLPPATTFAPPPSPGQGPLPGPSPHESCHPYVSNQPFQHPWDECLTCVCTEAFTLGHVTVEVICFAKKSCCVETSALIEPASISGGEVTAQVPSLSIHPICELKSFGVEFTHPQDNCIICSCELQGNLIVPGCKRSPKPECNSPFYPGVGISNEFTGVSTNTLLPSISLAGSTAYYGSQSQISGESNTVTISPIGIATNTLLPSTSLHKPPGYSGPQSQPSVDSYKGTQAPGSYQNSYKFIPGQSGQSGTWSGVGSGNAFLSESAQEWNLQGQYQIPQISGYPAAEAEQIGVAGYSEHQPSYYAGYNLNYPGLIPSEAEMLTLSGYKYNQPSYYPKSSLIYPGSISAKVADNKIQYRPNLPVQIENFGSSAPELSNPSQIPTGQYAYKYKNLEGYLENEAEANANVQYGVPQNSISYPFSAGNYKQFGVPASSLYPSLYRPGYEMAPPLQSTKYSQYSSSSNIQNQATASASATSAGGPLIKSGNPEDNNASE